ncbi:DUF3306 domain-containing protein [Rhizobacter sp. Root404]|uniref:DUF3306 domain-containing protein n=1 Tax=Rhizobacter sp. Root404 TaxID=1736528 RepID=UPI0009E90ED8|nr:DUF3306 domain-containing protein [Rhizobacter sp. Root404]
MTTEAPPDGFLSRWSRRKAQVREGAAALPATEHVPVQAPATPSGVEAPVVARAAPASVEVTPTAPPMPTLADVAQLTRESDYSRFVAGGVDEGVKRAAMKKLFTDPHFNVMDGLDTYIDDYGKPDPIPLAMLRQMNQSKFLKLFDEEEEKDKDQDKPAPAADVATPETLNAPDDHADLRLQQDDAVGQPGPAQGAGA